MENLTNPINSMLNDFEIVHKEILIGYLKILNAQMNIVKYGNKMVIITQFQRLNANKSIKMLKYVLQS